MNIQFNKLKFLKKIQKNNFIVNILIIASGTATAQIINVLFSPIITRLYGPETFGVFGVFGSVISILTTIVALTYPTAIVLPKKDIEAIGLIKLSLYITICTSIFISLILVFFGDQVLSLLRVEILEPYIFLVPLVMVFAGGQQVAMQWLIRKKQFAIQAKVAVVQALLLNGSKAGVGFFHPVSSSLIIISSLGHGFYALMLLLGSKNTYKNPSERESNTSVIKMAKRYSEFPIYRGPQVLIAALTQTMPILMLTSLFGPAAAGFYAIGNRVLSIPSQLIGKAIGDVFYPRIVEAGHKKENISHLLIKATLSMAAVGMIPFGLIIFFGPELFSLVFGAEWEVAGVYASWIALWSFALFVSKPSIKTIPVLSAQKLHLIFTIINILVKASALTIGGLLFDSDIIGVALYGISGAILNTLLIIITISISRKKNITS